MLIESEKNQCVHVAESTGVFTSQELYCIKEVLDDCCNCRNDEYCIIVEKQKEPIAGFVIFGSASFTQFAWDIYWVVVAKEFQGMGIGGKIIKKVQDYVLQRNKKAVLRIETGTKDEFAPAREFYVRQGYEEAGKIPSFYADGDDLIIYYKNMG